MERITKSGEYLPNIGPVTTSNNRHYRRCFMPYEYAGPYEVFIPETIVYDMTGADRINRFKLTHPFNEVAPDPGNVLLDPKFINDLYN